MVGAFCIGHFCGLGSAQIFSGTSKKPDDGQQERLCRRSGMFTKSL